jgi:hypothetical protein
MIIKGNNRNHIIIWDTDFVERTDILNAVDNAATFQIGVQSITIPVLTNDVAHYGFDFNSVQITLQDTGAPHLASWNAVTKVITYYPPTSGIAVGNVRTLKYKFKDNRGVWSNEAEIKITAQGAPVVGFRVKNNFVPASNADQLGVSEYLLDGVNILPPPVLYNAQTSVIIATPAGNRSYGWKLINVWEADLNIRYEVIRAGNSIYHIDFFFPASTYIDTILDPNDFTLLDGDLVQFTQL